MDKQRYMNKIFFVVIWSEMSLLIGMDLLKQITVFYYLCQGLSIDKQRRTDESCSKYAIKHTD